VNILLDMYLWRNFDVHFFCFRMCSTRQVTLVLCGTSWEMNFVNDSLIMGCMVRFGQYVKTNEVSILVHVSHQSLKIDLELTR